MVIQITRVRRSKAVEKAQKEYHNKKFKRKAGFEILLCDAAKEKQWSGKLKEKGPYYIHDIIRNGAYTIKELDRRILKAPINEELLKKYIFSKKQIVIL